MWDNPAFWKLEQYGMSPGVPRHKLSFAMYFSWTHIHIVEFRKETMQRRCNATSHYVVSKWSTLKCPVLRYFYTLRLLNSYISETAKLRVSVMDWEHVLLYENWHCHQGLFMGSQWGNNLFLFLFLIMYLLVFFCFSFSVIKCRKEVGKTF